MNTCRCQCSYADHELGLGSCLCGCPEFRPVEHEVWVRGVEEL